jgi:adenine C2-methylase RlmN of 23S rRNA A2503 and tRNA A37
MPAHDLRHRRRPLQAATKQRVFVEYVMLADVNDLPEHADQLGQLLEGRDIVLNLIPW